MPTNTYVELRKETVAVATSTVTFDLTGISGYTDLEIVCNYASSNALSFLVMQVNGDTAGNYALTSVVGNGSSSANSQGTNLSPNWIGYQVGCQTALGKTMSTIKLLSYANSHAPKTYFAKNGNIGTPTYTGVEDIVGLWNNTAPITSITLRNNTGGTFYNFAVGSTFSIYGIKAVGGDTAVKATGGIVTEDSTYFYHTFKGSSTFTPLQSLTVDYLIVAGGGGGGDGDGGRGGGGGGAGGLRSSVSPTGGGVSPESTFSLTSATPYSVIVGAGGANNTNGNNSIFNNTTATAGGRGGTAGGAGAAGGSGGGASVTTFASSGGSPTTGQGFAGGGSTVSPQNNYRCASGGGAGGAGGGATTGEISEGGAGVQNSINGTATFYAAGGSGGNGQFSVVASSGAKNGIGGIGSFQTPSSQGATAGVINTGSGGGGAGDPASSRPATGGRGASGVVVIRYAKAQGINKWHKIIFFQRLSI